MDHLDFDDDNFEEKDELVDVKVVNRSVLIAHLNEDFYAWYKAFGFQNEESEEKVLETPHTFLIPPFEEDEEVEDYLAENFFVIFESLLEEYIADEEILVDALTEENFDRWVEYNFSTFVMDAASDYELGHEDDEIEGEEEENDDELHTDSSEDSPIHL